MSAAIPMILGCLLISITITYAWWLHLRVLFLQIDLADISQDFRAVIADRGQSEDADCSDLLDAIDDLIRAAPILTPASMELEPFHPSFGDQRTRRLPGWSSTLDRIRSRVVHYLEHENLVGWLLGSVAPEPDVERMAARLKPERIGSRLP